MRSYKVSRSSMRCFSLPLSEEGTPEEEDAGEDEDVDEDFEEEGSDENLEEDVGGEVSDAETLPPDQEFLATQADGWITKTRSK